MVIWKVIEFTQSTPLMEIVVIVLQQLNEALSLPGGVYSEMESSTVVDLSQ